MNVTLEQASKKWCPFARVYRPAASKEGEDAPVAYNRTYIEDCGVDIGVDGEHFNDKEATCIGPACMAWRESTDRFYAGYCGLAGRPS